MHESVYIRPWLALKVSDAKKFFIDWRRFYVSPVKAEMLLTFDRLRSFAMIATMCSAASQDHKKDFVVLCMRVKLPASVSF